MNLPSSLSSGDVARLIPVTADSNKEIRAVSVLTSTLMSVPPFSRVMLESIGQRVGARADISCYTEVVFKSGPSAEKLRPDGLIVLDGGRGRVWQCLVEAKIARAELNGEQVEKYLGLAKANGIDAVLTLSNQFATLPTHSPIKLPKSATRGVDVFHWSWMYLLTEAMLLLDNHEFAQPEQRYILAEMVRYFSHPSTGISTFDRMNPEWRDLNTRVQAGANLSRTDSAVENSVAAWHQEVRDLCLLFTRKVGRPVRVRLSRAHAADPELRLRDDCAVLCDERDLRCCFEIPDAAAPINVSAGLVRRSITVSMIVGAPKDRQRTSSRANWLLRQLNKTAPQNVHVRATWPGRAPTTQVSLEELREDPLRIQPDNQSLVPTQFEVLLVRDLAGKFGGTKTFIQELEETVPYFYEQIGQHLRAYVAPPPRFREPAETSHAPTPIEQVEDVAEEASSDALDDVMTSSASGESQHGGSAPGPRKEPESGDDEHGNLLPPSDFTDESKGS